MIWNFSFFGIYEVRLFYPAKTHAALAKSWEMRPPFLRMREDFRRISARLLRLGYRYLVSARRIFLFHTRWPNALSWEFSWNFDKQLVIFKPKPSRRFSKPLQTWPHPSLEREANSGRPSPNESVNMHSNFILTVDLTTAESACKIRPQRDGAAETYAFLYF